MNFSSLLSDIIATVIGGIFITFLFFLIREKIFPHPKISGKWHFRQETLESSYNPYVDMALEYIVIICSNGLTIEGSAEKIYEKTSSGNREYTGKSRTRSKISGSIERNYFSKDKIFLHIIENSNSRESSHFYELTIKNKNEMHGSFQSMIASQSGTIKCQRNPFSR